MSLQTSRCEAMVSQVALCINHACRVRKLDIEDALVRFAPGYNALIGPNGSGKSSVLKALAACPLCRIEAKGDYRVKYITTETLNPLVGGTFGTREEMLQGVRAMFRSHGQGVLDTLAHQSDEVGTVILVDSPETGQDHDNCLRIHKGLLELAATSQVIVATTSLVFMRGANVVDLGHDYQRELVAKYQELLANMTDSVNRGMNRKTLSGQSETPARTERTNP